MRRLIIAAPNREYAVEIAPTPEGFAIRCGERRYRVTQVKSRGTDLTFRLEGRTPVEADIRWSSETACEIMMEQIPFQLKVWDADLKQIAGAGTAGGADGKKSVHARMPGRIVAIPVTVGQRVKKGEPLLIMEAMKMQNEIMAPCDGVIKTIHVAAGASVDGGAPLVELE